MEINGRGNRGWKTLQKGIREHLLCTNCEQHLNHKYEKPFHKQWLVDLPLPDRIAENAAHTVVYDYLTFKLFHLSILFRASVSSLPTFREVNLGVHEERIRKMLISESPGQDWEYPILAFAVLNGHGEVEKRLMSCPLSSRYEGHIAYWQIYGGAVWMTLVSSHPNDQFCREGLQPSGQITMKVKPWSANWSDASCKRSAQA